MEMELIDRIVSVIYNDLNPLRFTHIVLNKKDLKHMLKTYYHIYYKNKGGIFNVLDIKVIRSKDIKVGSFLLVEDFKKNEKKSRQLNALPDNWRYKI